MEAVEKLLHEAAYLLAVELEHGRVEQAEQVVVHVLEDEIEFAAVFAKVERVLLVGHDLDHVDDVGVLQLTQYLDLAHGRDREALLLVLELDALERHQLVALQIARLEHLAVRALANHRQALEHVHAALAPLGSLQLVAAQQHHRPLDAAHRLCGLLLLLLLLLLMLLL